LGPDRLGRTCPIGPVYMEMAELKMQSIIIIIIIIIIITRVRCSFDYTDTVIKIFKARSCYSTACMVEISEKSIEVLYYACSKNKIMSTREEVLSREK
jgi:hypothetical protein